MIYISIRYKFRFVLNSVRHKNKLHVFFGTNHNISAIFSVPVKQLKYKKMRLCRYLKIPNKRILSE